MIKNTRSFSSGPPPWDDIEPGIVDRVRLFHDAGMHPVASCEGHGRAPWIHLLETNVEKIHHVLLSAGESGFAIELVHAFPFPTEDVCDVYCRVYWWREPTL